MTNKKGAGRPSIENKRIPLTVRLKPELKEWVTSREISAGAFIEGVILETMKKDNL